jgi:hypothetical protein
MCRLASEIQQERGDCNGRSGRFRFLNIGRLDLRPERDRGECDQRDQQQEDGNRAVVAGRETSSAVAIRAVNSASGSEMMRASVTPVLRLGASKISAR